MKYNKLRDDLALGRLSRRDLTKLMAAAGVAMVTMPLTRGARAAAGDLTYFTWSGYDLPGFFPQYVEKHGGPPATALFSDEEEALQKLRAGFECDVAHPCSARTRRWREAGVIQSFDTSRLSNWGDVFPKLKSINGADADGKQWFAPVDWGNTSVIYRTDLFDLQGQPESWTMLWDDRYAGKLSIGEDITDTGVIIGLLIGAKNPYQLTDDELNQVREMLQKQKPLLRFYWSDTTALEQAMASGEVVASSAWNSSVVTLRCQGVPVAYANPKEGILAWCCGLVVTSTSKQLDLAHDLIDAMISPEAGQWLITEYGYGHSNKKAFELVDAATLEEIGLPSDPSEMFAKAVFSQENTRLEELQQIFEEVKAGL
ncbi:MAG TPA: extracellular solute-binding protein [Kiloniellales bacterium]|nr:extracellular solute-binding protein [Kiloniellales bacterium]